MKIFCYFSVFALCFFLSCATPAISQDLDLGEIDFPNSGAAAAQDDFIQGVLLLHSFEYWDARRAFQKAQGIDPDFALAYWGEAMTHNHPVWARENVSSGKAALSKLGGSSEARLAKAPTEREKDYLRTLDILFGEGDKVTRNLAYMEVMKALAEKYPDDHEAASFYSLSILGTAQGKRDFRIYMRAGAVAQKVFEKNPRHPGAAHYVIHSFDDPIHAPLGLPAAHVYADIAPDAPHALHMPSHIFMALGMWEESSKTNIASRSASLKKGDHGLHATWWLTYSHLQEGMYDAAMALIEDVEARLKRSPSRHLRNHLAYMKAAYLVETRQWDAVSLPQTINPSDYRLQGSSTVYFTNGLRAYHQDKLTALEAALANLKSLPANTARYSDEEALEVMVKILEGLVAYQKGANRAALTSLEAAIKLQEAMSLEFGPPIPVKPVYEIYGEVLMAMDRPAEAQEAFRNALFREPGRALGLLGMARAAKAAGNTAVSEKAYQDLAEVWRAADENLPEAAELGAD